MHKGDGNLTGDVCTRNDGWLGTGVSADNSTKRKQRGDSTGKFMCKVMVGRSKKYLLTLQAIIIYMRVICLYLSASAPLIQDSA